MTAIRLPDKQPAKAPNEEIVHTSPGESVATFGCSPKGRWVIVGALGKKLATKTSQLAARPPTADHIGNAVPLDAKVSRHGGSVPERPLIASRDRLAPNTIVQAFKAISNLGPISPVLASRMKNGSDFAISPSTIATPSTGTEQQSLSS